MQLLFYRLSVYKSFENMAAKLSYSRHTERANMDILYQPITYACFDFLRRYFNESSHSCIVYIWPAKKMSKNLCEAFSPVLPVCLDCSESFVPYAAFMKTKSIFFIPLCRLFKITPTTWFHITVYIDLFFTWEWCYYLLCYCYFLFGILSNLGLAGY